MAESTYEQVADGILAEHAGDRRIRGISRPLPVFRVLGLAQGRDRVAASDARVRAVGLAAGLLLGAAILAPATLHAQGMFQFDLSARLELAGYLPGDDPAYIIPATTPFVAPRASLLGDLFVGDHLYGLLELRFDRGPQPTDTLWEFRVDQAFLRFTPGEMNLHAQLGRFVTPFGEYPQRHHTTADPFIRPPFPYEYRTALAPDSIAANVNDFLTWKDQPDAYRVDGTITVWNLPYQIGGMLFGGTGPLSFRAAVMNSAPASRTYDWGGSLTKRPSFVGHVGARLTPELELGASYDRGPYLSTHLPATLDTFPILPGHSAQRDDYLQRIWGVNAAFLRGAMQMRGEVFFDSRDVPNVGEAATSTSFSLEAAVRFGAGFDVAARYGAIRFGEIDGEPWDHDASRVQIAAGYRLSQAMDARVEFAKNSSDAAVDFDDDLLSLRFAWDLDRFWGF